MNKYLVLQHGKCRSEGTGKIKLFPLPKDVKIIFLTTAGRMMYYPYIKNYISGLPTHLNNSQRVYNKNGSFVPDLVLGSDYQFMAGHTWKYPISANKNIRKSNEGVVYTDPNIKRIVGSDALPTVKQFALKLRTTTLSRLVKKIGPGTYIVGSCRKIGSKGNRNTPDSGPNTNSRIHARILRSLDTHGGNLNKVIKDIPTLHNHVGFTISLK